MALEARDERPGERRRLRRPRVARVPLRREAARPELREGSQRAAARLPGLRVGRAVRAVAPPELVLARAQARVAPAPDARVRDVPFRLPVRVPHVVRRALRRDDRARVVRAAAVPVREHRVPLEKFLRGRRRRVRHRGDGRLHDRAARAPQQRVHGPEIRLLPVARVGPLREGPVQQRVDDARAPPRLRVALALRRPGRLRRGARLRRGRQAPGPERRRARRPAAEAREARPRRPERRGAVVVRAERVVRDHAGEPRLLARERARPARVVARARELLDAEQRPEQGRQVLRVGRARLSARRRGPRRLDGRRRRPGPLEVAAGVVERLAGVLPAEAELGHQHDLPLDVGRRQRAAEEARVDGPQRVPLDVGLRVPGGEQAQVQGHRPARRVAGARREPGELPRAQGRHGLEDRAGLARVAEREVALRRLGQGLDEVARRAERPRVLRVLLPQGAAQALVEPREVQEQARAVPFRSRRRRARDGRLSFQRCLRDDRHVGERAAPVHPHVDAVAPRAHAPAAARPLPELGGVHQDLVAFAESVRRVVVVGLARVDDVVPVGPRVRAVGVVVRHEPRAELQREARRPRLAVLERLDDEPRDVADEPARPVLPARVGRERHDALEGLARRVHQRLERHGRVELVPSRPARVRAGVPRERQRHDVLEHAVRGELLAGALVRRQALERLGGLVQHADVVRGLAAHDVAGFGAHRQLGRLRAPPVPAGARDRVGRASIARTVGVAGRELLGQVSPEEKPP